MSSTIRTRCWVVAMSAVVTLTAGCSFTVQRPAAAPVTAATTSATIVKKPAVTSRPPVKARTTTKAPARAVPKVSVATGPPPFPGHYFHPGDYSPTIKVFQDQMHARGFFPVGTGNYGPNTLAMVERLQAQNGLIPNGEIGPNTWKLAWTGSYNPNETVANVYIGRCYYSGETLEIRPVTVSIGCDGTGELTHMVWSNWTAESADGTGSGTFTDCVPDCGTGPRYTVPVVVHLSDPRKAQEFPTCAGDVWWATMTIAFPGDLPPFFEPDDTPDTFNGMPASSDPDLPSEAC